MPNLLVVLLVAIMGGVAVVLQANFNGLMDKTIGTLESVFITYGLGGAIAAVLMLAYKGGNLPAVRSLPWYVWTAGLCGLVIIGALSYSVPRLGLVVTFTVFVATQFIVGALFDHFGVLGAELRPFTLTKLIGIAVVLFGIWLIIKQ